MQDVILKFFLNFKNDATGRIEITEVAKFDGASFSLKQDKGRWGRDVTFGNEDVSLLFLDGFYDRSENPLQLPDSTIVYNLTMGLPFLLQYYKTYGFESEIEFIVNKDGLDFTTGVLDMQLAKTDLYSYLECKVVQQTERRIIKQQAETKVDVFSDKDINLQPIAPVATSRILLKAKPVVQVSKWISTGQSQDADSVFGPSFFNRVKTNTKSEIQTSKSWLLDYSNQNSSGGDYDPPRENFIVVKANGTLTEIVANIKLRLQIDKVTDGGFDSNINVVRGFLVKGEAGTSFADNYDLDDPTSTTTFQFFTSQLLGDNTGIYSQTVNQDLEIDLGSLSDGGELWFVFSFNSSSAFSRYRIDFQDTELELKATNTAVDSVIEGVRYIDLLKQVAKSVNGIPVVAPRWDVGGEFYDQFVFNGLLIRQFVDKPFYNTFKDLYEGLQEVAGDYQINETEIFAGIYNDFYPNRELAAFHQAPDSDFEAGFNPQYTIATLEYRYENYEKDRNEENTIDGVHTEAQWKIPNRLVDNNKKISVSHERDPFGIESARRQGITAKPTTALDTDDRIKIIDVVELAPGTRGQFTLNLMMQVLENGNLQILNSSNGEESDIRINWLLLGTTVGAHVEILAGQNFGSYIVLSMTESVITLAGLPAPTFSGTALITFSYPLTNVKYVNRTNEGFSLIQNLESGSNFSNLKYTIRRNLIYWEPYLATACKFKPNGIISNTYFKNNGELITRFGLGTTYKENENINVADLAPAILSPRTVKVRLAISFEDAVQLYSDMQRVYPDGTTGGFLRTPDPNGGQIKFYPTELDYEWATGVMNCEGEVKNESDYLTIVSLSNGLIEINEVGYDPIILANEWYRLANDYLTLFDTNEIPLCNPTKIELVSVNGVVYNDADDLALALSNL